MILSVLASVAVLAAIAVIVAALVFAETTLVFIALGLAGVSVLLLVGALIQGRTRADRTDGLGKSSVPAAAYTTPEHSGRVPAPAPEPVREPRAWDDDSGPGEPEYDLPRWQTPTATEWPEPATVAPAPAPAEPSWSPHAAESAPAAAEAPEPAADDDSPRPTWSPEPAEAELSWFAHREAEEPAEHEAAAEPGEPAAQNDDDAAELSWFNRSAAERADEDEDTDSTADAEVRDAGEATAADETDEAGLSWFDRRETAADTPAADEDDEIIWLSEPEEPAADADRDGEGGDAPEATVAFDAPDADEDD
ncbi:AAA family ATPase, partial [Nocardiopsis sp. frass1]